MLIVAPMVYETQNYRSFLKATLAEKIKANPQFSLRSFAQFLGISHGGLSQVFNGTKNLSFDRAREIAIKLKLSEQEREYFCTLVQYESAKSLAAKADVLDKLNRLRPQGEAHHLSVDKFKLIADWYHLPILSMTLLKDFDFTAKNVAQRLGITELEADVAIERLGRLHLLDKDSNGKYYQTQQRFMVDSSEASTALRTFHAQCLEKAMIALEKQPPLNRINGSETFAFSKSKLPEAREITEKYYNEMLKLAGEEIPEGHTDVFHLQVNCFSLTDLKKQELT